MRLLLAICLISVCLHAQDTDQVKPDAPKTEPKYDDTFSGTVMDLSTTKVVIERSILGKPPERRSFLIKLDTRVEGRLRARTKVTVGFVTTDEGDVARLIVVRAAQKKK